MCILGNAKTWSMKASLCASNLSNVELVAAAFTKGIVEGFEAVLEDSQAFETFRGRKTSRAPAQSRAERDEVPNPIPKTKLQNAAPVLLEFLQAVC